MAFLERNSVVSYRCSCGRFKPLPRTYFCRHCFVLRCEFCVFHEIDSRFCSSCLENLTVTDALMRGNKCANCLQCPMCHSMLSTRISNTKGKEKDGADEKPVIKYYYLGCLFCHWSTRDIGMEDLTTVNKWPELENLNSERLQEIIDYYKALSIQDRQSRDKKLHGARRPYAHISGMSVAMVRQKAGLSGAPSLAFRSPERFHDPSRQLKIKPAVAEEAIDDLPADIYTSVPDLTQVSTVKQRHQLPEQEPQCTKNLKYFRKNLTGKRSLRCRTCEHNVIKPEFFPNSIKFKIQLSAYYLVPEIRIKTVEPLRAGQTSRLLLLIINPTQHPTTVTILPFDQETSDSKEELVSVPVKDTSVSLTAQVDIPAAAVTIPGRDDAAEFDEPSETPNFNDDPKLVTWRKGNKIVLSLNVRPEADLPVGSQTLIGFTLSHIYTNTVILLEKKQLNKVDHSFKLLLDLGKTVGV